MARACFNLGSILEPNRQQLMIEVEGAQCEVRAVRPPPPAAADDEVAVGFHANLYESPKLKGTDGGGAAHPSSEHRMRRMGALPPAASVRALKVVISDTSDPEYYPIHRDGHSPRADGVQTLNSALFDVSARTVSVWGVTAPLSAARPTIQIDWRSLAITTPSTSASSDVPGARPSGTTATSLELRHSKPVDLTHVLQ